jgi:hypothetical protein
VPLSKRATDGGPPRTSIVDLSRYFLPEALAATPGNTPDAIRLNRIRAASRERASAFVSRAWPFATPCLRHARIRVRYRTASRGHAAC